MISKGNNSRFNRLYSLDYLRGYAAFTIMIYHYLSWSDYHGFMNFFFGKAGYYGVELFYVLSGFTLAFVYSKRGISTKKTIWGFYQKRIFRIFPLLWLVTLITLILNKRIPELDTLLINLTGAFSVYRITDYIAIGAWSIGNELFFYLCFPFLLLAKRNWAKILVASIISVPFILFAFNGGIFEANTLFSWKDFINPLGHLLMFYAGVILFNSRIKVGSRWARLIILLTLLLFVLIPFGHREETVQGIQRIGYSVLAILLVLSSVNLNKYKNNYIHRFSKMMGETSYSLYLLHPIVWGVIGYFVNLFNLNWLKDLLFLRVTLCVVLSLFVSFVVYEFYEKKFVQLGKKYTLFHS